MGAKSGKTHTYTHIKIDVFFIKIFAVLHCLLVILHHYEIKFKSVIHSALPSQPALLVSRLLCNNCGCTVIDGDCVCSYNSDFCSWWRVVRFIALKKMTVYAETLQQNLYLLPYFNRGLHLPLPAPGKRNAGGWLLSSSRHRWYHSEERHVRKKSEKILWAEE